jgi:hypothetical protein
LPLLQLLQLVVVLTSARLFLPAFVVGRTPAELLLLVSFVFPTFLRHFFQNSVP